MGGPPGEPATPSDVHAWLQRQHVLLEHERQAERTQNALLLSQASPKTLARHGLALLGLCVSQVHIGAGAKTYVVWLTLGLLS